jgi:alpha-L-rhamnosidase
MEWNDSFVEPEGDIYSKIQQPASYLRRSFTLSGDVVSAVLHMTAFGTYRGFVNGRQVDDQVFMPGFTYYRKRLQYQTYDVTLLLARGENVIGAILGDGWYRGKLGLRSTRNLYGEKVKLLAVLEIEYADGTHESIMSDGAWKATQNGPIRKSDWQDGEVYDARLEMDGWSAPSFDDSGWHGVRVSSYAGELVPSLGERIVEQETFKPTVIGTPDGATVLDFGQNLLGYVEFTVRGSAGHVVTLRHGETLDENGDFTLKNLSPEGGAFLGLEPLLQRITCTLKDGEQTYKPTFTAHGFRYVKLENWPEPVRPENFTSIAVYSEMAETGYFECSNPSINQLVSNARWSQKSNFLDVPTDCPTRERSPWTGDIAVFCETGSYLMDTRRFLAKWLKDVALQQREDGCVDNIIPSVEKGLRFIDGSAAWGDAAVIVPYVLYKVYGDVGILEEQYDSMVRWMGFLEKRAGKTHPFRWLKKNPYRAYTIDTGYHWGEWLEPGHSMFRDIVKNVIKSDSEVATAYYAYSSRLVSEIAGILGREEDARKYRELSENIRKSYRYNFTDGGVVKSKRQCKYVRPVALDLLAESEKEECVRFLNGMIVKDGFRIGTGFLTTPFVLSVLADHGYVETAYRLLENTRRPGWLYEVEKGATTIWENWNGIDDSGVPTDSMNHYSFGVVVGWLFSHAAGITPLEPGYGKVRIKPVPGGSLTFARCSFNSPAGLIKSEWATGDKAFRLDVEVPVETQVHMPDGTVHDVRQGKHAFTCDL